MKLLLIILSLVYSSYSIELIQLSRIINIKKGERAEVSWEFKDAEKVIVDGMNFEFKAKDSYLFVPRESKQLLITAISGSDTLTAICFIKINEPKNNEITDQEIDLEDDLEKNTKLSEAEDDFYMNNVYGENPPINNTPDNNIKYDSLSYMNIDSEKNIEKQEYKKVKQTLNEMDLPKNLSFMNYKTSYTKSKYFNGIIEDFSQISINNMKITSVQNIGNNVTLRALIMDEFGNYVPNLTQEKLIKWKIHSSCDKNFWLNSENTSEIRKNDVFHYSFLIDNSAVAEKNSMVLSKIKEFVEKLDSNSKISFSFFDNDYVEIISGASKNEFMEKELWIPSDRKLNSIYKACFKNLNAIKTDNLKKVIIVLTYSSNNSASIYNISDVIEESNNLNTPIFTVNIGEYADSFTLKYLSYGAAGSYYKISNEEITDLDKILNEISFSLNNYYEFNIDFPENNCKYYSIETSLIFNENEFIDHPYFVKESEWLGAKNQMVALFKYKDSEVDQKFNETIASLSRVLVDNPQFGIEVIGYSGIEGTNQSALELSKKRAEMVAAEFEKLGVDNSRIKQKWLGNQVPLFIKPTNSWQQYYNRRVEVRWLIPELQPYELVIDQEIWTEDDAVRDVNMWQQRGYKAYFERYLDIEDGERTLLFPLYRVKIWGFSTEDQAQSEKLKIAKIWRTKSFLD